MTSTDTLAQQFAQFPLDSGSHSRSSGALCVMECVAYVAGVAHTDHPTCACPVITEVVTHVNDFSTPAVRAALASRVLRLAGSRGDAEVTKNRAFFLVDFLLRRALPPALSKLDDAAPPSLAGAFTALAGALTALPPICAPEDLLAANTLVARIPRDAKFGTDHLTSGAEIRDRLEKLRFRLFEELYQIAAFNVTDLVIDLGVEVDYLPLVDALLDIGSTPALDVTPEVAGRIAVLANRKRPVPR